MALFTHTTMELQIQLSSPCRQVFTAMSLLAKVVEELDRLGNFDTGHFAVMSC